MNNKTKFIVQAGLIAAIYSVLTIALAAISYGPIQVRVSEALTILPYFTPAAIPGLFIGCIVSNMYGGYGLMDIIFGSTATLIASILTYSLRKYKYVVPLPPVIVNAIVIGTMIAIYEGMELSMNILLPFMLWVGVGQLIACYGLGLPLLFGLDKYKTKIFK